MNNVEYNICSSKYVSIHLTSFVSHLRTIRQNTTITDPLMKAVFILPKEKAPRNKNNHSEVSNGWSNGLAYP